MWTAEDSSKFGRRLYQCLNFNFGAVEAALVISFPHCFTFDHSYTSLCICNTTTKYKFDPYPSHPTSYSLFSLSWKRYLYYKISIVFIYFSFFGCEPFFFVIRCLSLVTIHVCQFKLQSSYSLLGHVLYICCGFWTMEFHWLTI